MGKGIFRLIFLSTAVEKGTNLTVLAMEANQKRVLLGTAKHILVKTEEKPEQILIKIKSGEDFSRATKERSQDDRTRQMGEELLQYGLPHADNVPAE